MLSKYEACRIVGIRALQLASGVPSHVEVQSRALRENLSYVASLELSLGILDMQVVHGGEATDVRDCDLPPCVNMLIDNLDGGNRSMRR